MDEKLSLKLWYKMNLIREFELFAGQKKTENEIYGMVHSCIGEEAVAVGVCAALENDDYIVSNHRAHGHALAKGVSAEALMAEMLGRAAGTNSGKGGSMHISDMSVGMLASTGIVGSGIPIACGAAFAVKYRGEKHVVCVFLGDGAANEGVFYETMNLASIWKLPIIFVLEDNGIAVTTETRNTSACKDYCQFAENMGLAAYRVDGQEIEQVYKTAELAIQNAREYIPCMIHAKTIRFREHAEGAYYLKMANTGYRDMKKIQKERIDRDPIQLYRKKLEGRGVNSDMLNEIQAKAVQTVKNAYLYAMELKLPAAESAKANLYGEV